MRQGHGRSIGPSRRTFLAAGSTAGAFAGVPASRAEGESRPGPVADAYRQTFPIAETVSGKVRGLDYAGIKAFRGVPYGETASCPRARPSLGSAFGMLSALDPMRPRNP
jgi:hypothetical protein